MNVFLYDAVHSLVKNVPIIHFKLNSWREDPETTKFFKTRPSLSTFALKCSCFLNQNYNPKKQNALK